MVIVDLLGIHPTRAKRRATLHVRRPHAIEPLQRE
jgi:hypothetical protein